MSERLLGESAEKRLCYVEEMLMPHVSEFYRYASQGRRPSLEVAGWITPEGIIQYVPDRYLKKYKVDEPVFVKSDEETRQWGIQGKIPFHFHRRKDLFYYPSDDDVIFAHISLSLVHLSHANRSIGSPEPRVTIIVPKEILPVEEVIKRWKRALSEVRYTGYGFHYDNMDRIFPSLRKTIIPKI